MPDLRRAQGAILRDRLAAPGRRARALAQESEP